MREVAVGDWVDASRVRSLWNQLYPGEEAVLGELLGHLEAKRRAFPPSRVHPFPTRGLVYSTYADAFGEGLDGVRAQLPRLADLGVTVLWLLPLLESPGRDQGFDISDYTRVDPAHGGNEALRRLLPEARARGMDVMMDLVLNHSSDQHPWFVSSRSPDSPQRDWYFWCPGKDGGPPNNWVSYFGGPAWTKDSSGQWYLHHFFPEQPDLNWDSPGLRRALYDAIRFWQDEGIAAFRLDAIHHIGKPAGLPDAPVTDGLWGPQVQYKNTPETHHWLQELHREVFEPSGAFTVGETGGTTAETSRLYTDRYRGELDAIFHFDHVHHLHEWTAAEYRASMVEWATALAGGWDAPFYSNHDLPRHVSAFGDDGAHREVCAKAFAGLLLTQWGTPFVYQGEELGMTNVAFDHLDDYRDEASKAWMRDQIAQGKTQAEAWAFFQRVTRDNARTPYQWDATPNAGFTTGTPWLGVNPDHVRVNWAAQRPDPDSVLAFYRRLIALRKAEPVLRTGTTAPWGPDHPTVLAYLRGEGTDAGQPTWGVVCQMASAPATWTVPEGPGGTTVVANHPAPPDLVPGKAVTLRPWEFLLVRYAPRL